MRRVEKIIALFFIVALLTLYIFSSTDWIISDVISVPVSVKVIMGKDDEGNWKNCMKGMDFAANLYDIDLDYVFLQDNDGVKEHIKHIVKAEEEAYSVVITIPFRNEKVASLLEESNIEIPIMVLDDIVGNSHIFSCVSGNKKQMGEELANHVIKEEFLSGKRVLLVEKEGTSYEAYKQGVMQKLSKLGAICDVHLWKDEKELFDIFNNMNPESIVVGIDSFSLNTLTKLYDKEQYPTISLYGNGWNDGIRRSLEKKEIKAITVINGFDMGYHSIIFASAKINKGKADPIIAIDHYLVTSDTMYQTQYEKILFPR